jgi:hypothetical protein
LAACPRNQLYLLEPVADRDGLLAAGRQPKRRAIARRPNNVAAAVWIEAGNERVLLGSDLEETPDPDTGWSVIVQSPQRPVGNAAVFKIPHHGSNTAHSDDVWNQMVAQGAYAILTPFVNAGVRLPTEADIARIRQRAGSASITSKVALLPIRRSLAAQRAIRASGRKLTPVMMKMGHIRLRKRFERGARWYVSYSGAAQRL